MLKYLYKYYTGTECSFTPWERAQGRGHENLCPSCSEGNPCRGGTGNAWLCWVYTPGVLRSSISPGGLQAAGQLRAGLGCSPLKSMSSSNTSDRDFSTWESCLIDRLFFCKPLEQPSLIGYHTTGTHTRAIRFLPLSHTPPPGISLCTRHQSPITSHLCPVVGS